MLWIDPCDGFANGYGRRTPATEEPGDACLGILATIEIFVDRL